jgi:hypothetical protein
MAYYWNKKGTADSYKQIDVRYMQREGFLTEGRKSYLTWTTTRTGQVVGRVNYEVRQDSLCISYNARKDSSEAWRPYEYHVPLTYTACNYGGSRIWAKCPHCHKRVAVLYLSEALACRTCHNLNYRSQQTSKGLWQDRDRMNKVREKLGWPLCKDVLIRSKPKGMHWKTFERLTHEHDLYQKRYLGAAMDSLNKMYAKAGLDGNSIDD